MDTDEFAAAKPGAVIIYRNRSYRVLERRKDDDSGWWLVGGGGLDDQAFAMGDWTLGGDDETIRVIQANADRVQRVRNLLDAYPDADPAWLVTRLRLALAETPEVASR